MAANQNLVRGENQPQALFLALTGQFRKTKLVKRQ